MNDEINCQLSAFIDDELTPEESELFVRRLCRDEALRHTAACYAAIGDVLRGDSAVTAPSEFAAGVMMAVEGQTVPVERTPAARKRPVHHWGFALAASVALAAVALMTLPSRGPDGLDTVTADIAEPAPVVVATNPKPAPAVYDDSPEPESLIIANTDLYNVPIVMPATAENRGRLNNLLVQHLYSSGRTIQPVGFRNVGFVTQTEER